MIRMLQLLLKFRSIFTFILLVTMAYLLFFINKDDSVMTKCLQSEFQLKGMNSCHPLLTCKDFANIRIGKLVGVGSVKAVYHAKWKEFDLALSVLNNPEYENDFFTGIENIKLFQQNPLTIQAVGFCAEDKMFLTEMHKNGDASKLLAILKKHTEVKDGILLRINLCLAYSLILVSLHHTDESAMGNPYQLPRVMCDSNYLKKLLSQFLVTDGLLLILNDMDALPPVTDGGIKCGHQELNGDFIAPEQLWRFPGNYNHTKMPGYDEKTDIWKAPSVCNFFLSNVQGGNEIKMQLAPLHERCKHSVPKYRPTAIEISKQYLAVKTMLEEIMQ